MPHGTRRLLEKATCPVGGTTAIGAYSPRARGDSRRRAGDVGAGGAGHSPGCIHDRAAVTEPSAMVAEVHDRMPVVLEPDQFTPWLGNEAGLEILTPADEGVLERWPVSKRVNSS
jgi:hypothetical protein